jgi:hypothetical protein
MPASTESAIGNGLHSKISFTGSFKQQNTIYPSQRYISLAAFKVVSLIDSKIIFVYKIPNYAKKSNTEHLLHYFFGNNFETDSIRGFESGLLVFNCQ